MVPDCHLKTKCGLFLDVRKFTGGALKLQVVDAQNKECNVSVFKNKNNTKKMAFCFKHGGNYFYLKVNGENLELEMGKCEEPDSSVDQYWFLKEDVGSGEHYVLCTVVSPVQYISVRRDSVTLHGSNCVLVTDEAENAEDVQTPAQTGPYSASLCSAGIHLKVKCSFTFYHITQDFPSVLRLRLWAVLILELFRSFLILWVAKVLLVKLYFRASLLK